MKRNIKNCKIVVYTNDAIWGMGDTLELALADAQKFCNAGNDLSDLESATASPSLELKVSRKGGNVAFTVKDGIALLV